MSCEFGRQWCHRLAHASATATQRCSSWRHPGASIKPCFDGVLQPSGRGVKQAQAQTMFWQGGQCTRPPEAAVLASRGRREGRAGRWRRRTEGLLLVAIPKQCVEVCMH